MLPLAVYRIFSIEMINPNPSPTWRTAFGLSSIGPSDWIRTASNAEDDVRRFIGEIREYAAVTELDETILNRLIDKIIISAVEVIEGEKVQKVRIVYNFVGEIVKE